MVHVFLGFCRGPGEVLRFGEAKRVSRSAGSGRAVTLGTMLIEWEVNVCLKGTSFGPDGMMEGSWRFLRDVVLVKMT